MGGERNATLRKCFVFLFVQGILRAAFIDGMVAKRSQHLWGLVRVIFVQIIAEDFSY
jgi:hypothetical protein